MTKLLLAVVLAATACRNPVPAAPAKESGVVFLDATQRLDTMDDVQRIMYHAHVKQQASGGCLSKAQAQRLTIRAVPDTAYVNPGSGMAWDSTQLRAELHDPVTGATWVGTECQVWVQFLSGEIFANWTRYWYSVSNTASGGPGTYRVQFAVMTPTQHGFYSELFARDTGAVVAPRP